MEVNLSEAKRWLFKHKYELAMLILFLVTFHTRLAVDGMHFSHPGTVKAKDAVYYGKVAQYIADTGIVGQAPPDGALGFERIVDHVPPGQTMMVSGLLSLTGLQEWNAYYWIVVLMSALTVVLGYLIAWRYFNSKGIGLLVAAALVFPISFQKWMYYVYIGMWSNASVITFLLAIAYFGVLYWKKPSNLLLLFTSTAMSVGYLVHMSEMPLAFPILIPIVYRILTNKKTYKQKLISLLALGGIPLIIFLAAIPYQTLTQSGGITLGNPSENLIRGYADDPFYIELGQMHIGYLALAFIGVLLLLANYKKYKGILATAAWFYLSTHVFLYFLSHAGYISIRPRLFMIFPVVMIAAYGLYVILKQVIKTPSGDLFPVLALISIVLIGVGISGYTQTKQLMQYQNIPLHRYAPQRWIAENTPVDSTVYAFANGAQGDLYYMERQRYEVFLNQLGPHLQNRTELPVDFPGHRQWFNWLRSARVTGPFSIEWFELPEYSSNILDYNYVYLENINEGMLQLNSALAGVLTQAYNYTIVYSDGFAVVLENENL